MAVQLTPRVSTLQAEEAAAAANILRPRRPHITSPVDIAGVEGCDFHCDRAYNSSAQKERKPWYKVLINHGRRAAYVVNWKVASTSIRSTFRSVKDAHTWKERVCYCSKACVPQDYFIFTFVREPMQRYLAGVGEILNQQALGSYKCGSPGGKKQNKRPHCEDSMYGQFLGIVEARKTTSLLDDMTQLFLSGKGRGIPAYELIQSQLCAINPCQGKLNFSYIGKFEDLSTSWRQIYSVVEGKTPLAPKLMTQGTGMVEGTKPKSKFSAWKQLVSESHLTKKYNNALLEHFQADYMCLGYNVKENEAGNKGKKKTTALNSTQRAPCKEGVCIKAIKDHWDDFVQRKRHDAVRRDTV
mmetsp:Transcript_25061/g.79437  ORF Transcript_25061/g.79437 Transcript_25061/m.79437 type:complete len:355 (+) Transcript_25061:224-1288(+)